MFTRKQYLSGECTHRQYYAQFVSPSTKHRVLSWVKEEELKASVDPAFNDIPLATWDGMSTHLPIAIRFESVGDYATKAGLVCVVKEAAKQILEKSV